MKFFDLICGQNVTFQESVASLPNQTVMVILGSYRAWLTETSLKPPVTREESAIQIEPETLAEISAE